MSVPALSARVFAEHHRQGLAKTIIDVRTPAEFRELHVESARNLPIEALDDAAIAELRRVNREERVYVLCRSGSRGRKACEKLTQAGLPNAINIDGGTLACADAGVPMVHGRPVMSLERQVRVAAGTLVLIGVALGFLVHPAAFGLAAFIGAGLVFAGLSDTCGMGMLLARMPWNGAASVVCDAKAVTA